MRVTVVLFRFIFVLLIFSFQFLTAAEKKEKNEPEKKEDPVEISVDKSFADAIKDTQKIEGLFTFYRKGEKIFIEILPDQLDRIYLCSPTLESALGERSLLSAQMLDEFAFSFHRQHKNIQFLRKNVGYRADEKSPMNRALKRSFSDSILATAKLESDPHPDRKSFLIDAGQIFLTDIPQIGLLLDLEYRWPYRLDATNTAFASVRTFPQNVEIGTLIHFALDKIPAPPLAPLPVPLPPPPGTPPDARSLRFQIRYSLSALPENGYRPRLADDRIGHYPTQYQDFTSDQEDTPYIRYINRWHLEKKDPDAKLSPPKQPIVFWLENTIPEPYRKPITDGILQWNKAFEKIGFQDAIVVKQQPDSAEWDPADVRFSTVRWFISSDSTFAIGPSRVNPLTGQIFDADIGFAESLTRFGRMEFREFVDPISPPASFTKDPGKISRYCNYAEGAALQAAFGHNLLDARGILTNPSGEEKFLADFLTHIAAHEVGHTLGLRHNFRASSATSVDHLHNISLTSQNGFTGSVMDYIPVNIAPIGITQGEYWQTSLGPYDYWAIEYAYKPIPADNLMDELPDLRKIATRVAEPELAYGSEEEAFSFLQAPVGIDPRTNLWDFGKDPLKYYEERIKLVHELWNHLESRVGKPGEGYQALRRSFNNGLGELFIDCLNASKFIAGIYHHRDHIGDPGTRLPYEPVSPEDQHRALKLLNKYLFSADAFNLKPRLLNQLAINRFWTFDGDIFTTDRLDYPIHHHVIAIQKRVFDRVFHPVLLSRLQDLEVKYEDPTQTFTTADLFEGLRLGIWSELKSSNIVVNSYRRALQREHLDRLIKLVVTPDPAAPGDAAALARYDLNQIRAGIRRRLANTGHMNVMTKAHLQESLARIEEALNPQLQRKLT